jgi:hypothetical protein
MKILFHILVFVAVLVPCVGWAAEPPLAGHWKLDDAEGEAVLDSSEAKNHAKAVARPGRTAGKNGGAFTFNGKDSFVEIPNSKDLDKIQHGNYAIAAWFKPEIAPPGTDATANDAEFGIVIKTGWHEGLSYNRSKQFIMTHWLTAGVEPVWNGIGTWEEEFAPGQWYHVVGVVDQKERVVKVFVNGELKGTTEPWTDGAKARDYEQQTWKIGAAGPGNDQYAWFARGAIDDVRIYKEVLTDEQIKALYNMGATGKDK